MSSFQNINLKAEKISKSFFRKDFLFQDISFDLIQGDSLAILGRNGAGKSTLMKILANIMSSSSGVVKYKIDNIDLKENQLPGKVAYAAPYMNLYEEFTPIELCNLYLGMINKSFNKEKFFELLKEFSIEKHFNKQIKNFSSGMKQRIKIILALISNAPFIFLDEPGTNLDDSGREKVIELASKKSKEGNIVVIATNDPREISFCNKSVEIL